MHGFRRPQTQAMKCMSRVLTCLVDCDLQSDWRLVVLVTAGEWRGGGEILIICVCTIFASGNRDQTLRGNQ